MFLNEPKFILLHTVGGGDKGVHTFLKCIRLKVNVKTLLEFELTTMLINHYAMGILLFK